MCGRNKRTKQVKAEKDQKRHELKYLYKLVACGTEYLRQRNTSNGHKKSYN